MSLSVRQKLETIQSLLGLTQTKMAERLGVSFVAYNNWWTQKAAPRAKKAEAINQLYLEVTGQTVIPDSQLRAKKNIIKAKSQKLKNIVSKIIHSPDIHDEFILSLTYNSNSIEGNTLTEPETAAILFDNTTVPNKSLIEHLEARNHQAALNFLFNHILQKGKLDENFVLRTHAILMNGIRPDAGAYRNHAVRIVGANLPTANYASIQRLLPPVYDLVANNKKDIVTKCAVVHSKFEQIHPFSDGNGRVGRLLMNAMLLKAHVSPAIILQTQKRLYYTYLYNAQTKGDHSSLENFLCDSILRGFRILEPPTYSPPLIASGR